MRPSERANLEQGERDPDVLLTKVTELEGVIKAMQKTTREELSHWYKRFDKVERERDEAREALMKIEDAFVDGDDTYEAWRTMGNIARAALEGQK